MLLSNLIAEFIQNGMVDLSKSTTRNYTARMRMFARHMGPMATTTVLNFSTMQQYVISVSKDAPTGAEMHKYCLVRFCEYLIQRGYLQANPAKELRLPKVTRKRRTACPDNAIELLFEACDRLPRNPTRRSLAKAALSILTFAGLRRGELTNLRLEDVNLVDSSIIVRNGKGGKERVIYTCKECMDAIRAYLKVRPANCTHDFLLASSVQHGLKTFALSHLLDDLHDIAGLEERYTPHQLRHGYATRLLKNGVPLTTIQRNLGHTDLMTTAIYLHSDEESQKAAAHLSALKPSAPQEATKPDLFPTKRGRVDMRERSLRTSTFKR
jgi:integrase/recombinase XerD